MAALPTGTVTFLFTDIEGSTELVQRLGDRRFAEVLEEHRRLLRDALAEGHGQEISTHGDAFLVVFSRSRDALETAVAAQRAFTQYAWPDGTSLRVRMCLHTGEPVSEPGGYVGMDVHRAARICAAGHGGQILLSDAVRSLAARDLPAGVSLRDLGLHRLKDLREPEHLFQVVDPELPTDFPSLKSLDARPNNLPMQLTSFIGREQEMHQVKGLLSTTRLLTLSGSGGLGKTRLAIQVAADLADQFTDGAWLVELASLSDPSFIPQAIASQFGLREQFGRPLLTTLTEYLQPKHLLLVLDNCEHMISACARVADALLRGCPHLRILATSRETLGIIGETTWLVPPLSCPNPQLPPTLEHLKEYEAVRLFHDRAVAVRSFSLTPQNASIVAEVCQRLDGIPLAIELAAARLRILSVEQIAQRLDDRFRLLTGGSRTALPRHQTLRAAIDWSYGLLSEKECTLFRRLSVFAGGCTLDAAEAVCTEEGVQHDEVLELVAQLVNKSLLLVDQHNFGVRYKMLETILRFGQEKLLESGEEVRTRSRHVDFFLGLAERAEPHLHGPDQGAWLERLEIDHDNLRAALDWSLRSDRPEMGLRLGGTLWWFWYVRGYYREGLEWLRQALSKNDSASLALRARALGGAGYLATNQADYTAALTLLEESLRVWRQLGDKKGMALSLNWLGRLEWHQGGFARAADLYKESLSLFRELGAKDNISMLLNNLGVLAISQGEFEVARSFLEESLAIGRQLGEKQGISMTASNLGVIGLRQGDYAAARSLFEESLTIDRELGDKRAISSELEDFGLLAAVLGSPERAARLLGAAEAFREAIGTPLSVSARALVDYDYYLARVRAVLSEEMLATLWAEGRAMTLEQAIEYALRDEKRQEEGGK